MNLFGVMEVSGSALKAERIRAEVVAANMANAETTRTADGKPYERQQVVFASADSPGVAFRHQLFAAGVGNFEGGQAPPGGVAVTAVVPDRAQPIRRYDPQHPDADKDGYVNFPDINPLTEMVDLMGATRAYGLNSSAVQATKSMIASSIEILK
jgi:flagellar basal-body rod protein FlgC